MACYAPVALHSVPINQKRQLQAFAVIRGVLEWNELCTYDIICPFKFVLTQCSRVLPSSPKYNPVHTDTFQCPQCIALQCS